MTKGRRPVLFSLRHWWGIGGAFVIKGKNVKPLWSLLALALVPTLGKAQTSFPMLTHVTPVAVQRGTTAEVTVDCRTSSLYGAYKVLVEGTGVTMDVDLV